MKDKLMRTLGQFSQAILAPLTCLPAAGLLLAVGALLTSAPLSQVFPVLEWAPVRLVGSFCTRGCWRCCITSACFCAWALQQPVPAPGGRRRPCWP